MSEVPSTHTQEASLPHSVFTHQILTTSIYYDEPDTHSRCSHRDPQVSWWDRHWITRGTIKQWQLWWVSEEEAEVVNDCGTGRPDLFILLRTQLPGEKDGWGKTIVRKWGLSWDFEIWRISRVYPGKDSENLLLRRRRETAPTSTSWHLDQLGPGAALSSSAGNPG